mmetsp:Transcript_4315/g.4975  ORF Transcript_4315/g.4975 Transcript_4315/m.4975 type:complete len:960 (+) Transcript_4315:148-3027(+)
MVSGKELRERAEKEAAKKAEKEARKAAAAAKRAARAEAKEGKDGDKQETDTPAAGEDGDGGTADTTPAAQATDEGAKPAQAPKKGAKAEEEPVVEWDGWYQEDTLALLKAIKEFPKGCVPSEKERWAKIAGEVEGKSVIECFQKVKRIMEAKAAGRVDPPGPSKHAAEAAAAAEEEAAEQEGGEEEEADKAEKKVKKTKPKSKFMLKKMEQEKAAAERKKAKEEAEAAKNAGMNIRKTAEDLGFFIRTGPDAAIRATANMDICIRQVQLYGGRDELISNGVLQLTNGVKYGLVGRNGVGKTTLLRAIAEGTIKMPEYLHIIHVEQEAEPDSRSSLQTVLQSDHERMWLLEKEQMLLDLELDEHEGVTLQEIYERLDEMDSDTATSRAAGILSGLGFDPAMQAKATKEFSGGWRMRIALACALFMEPDLLLLDEPTNHLDVHALTWLEEFLTRWDKTVVIVSHDRGFLNAATTTTIFLHRKRLEYYGGSYDTFLKVRAEHRANEESTARTQNMRESHLKQFIARFGQGHKKMVRQAQCRMKMLAKLQEEAVEVDYDDPTLRLQFASATPLPPPCISVMNAAFGYAGYETLYEGLDFGLDMDSRVAIVGPNGAGKSTFLKLLEGEILPTEGWVNRHTKLRLARFSQHHLESMDLEQSGLQHMRKLEKDMQEQEARKYLGRFGLSGDLGLKPIKLLSGGQKSRLAFAELAWRQPHVMLLDEPTNHLDLETIESLAMSLNQFEGGVVLVSHDERLISLVCDEIWCVKKGDMEAGIPGRVAVFNGTFEQYKEKLRKEFDSKNLLAVQKKKQSEKAKNEKVTQSQGSKTKAAASTESGTSDAAGPGPGSGAAPARTAPPKIGVVQTSNAPAAPKPAPRSAWDDEDVDEASSTMKPGPAPSRTVPSNMQPLRRDAWGDDDDSYRAPPSRPGPPSNMVPLGRKDDRNSDPWDDEPKVHPSRRNMERW